MKEELICKITDKDIGEIPIDMKNPRLRLAARGIITKEDGKIALQKKCNTNEFKLIGGGIENEEEPSLAFKREVLEETGCIVEIIEQLGITEEYISMKNTKQISYIFVAKVINDLHTLELTEKEKNEGAELLWVTPEEALKLVKDSYDKLLPSNYVEEYDVYRMRFIALRDRRILERYLNLEIKSDKN